MKESAGGPSRQERAFTATLAVRLKASEEWQVQQQARAALEDNWKAGQEAALSHWRYENDSRVRVEEDWKALHESRMVNVRPLGAAVVQG